jgi:signal transduction histidine kinase
MMFHRGLSLRWRIASLTALATTIVSIIALLVAFIAVRNSILGDLQRGLRADAEKVASIYNGETSSAEPELFRSLTGRVTLQIYDKAGGLLAASSAAFETAEGALPPDVVIAALETNRTYSGELLGEQVRVALAPFQSGVVAVIASTAFIGAALRQVAQSLLSAAIILIVLSGLIGYLIAGSAIRPITQLARQAARLGPDNLEPIVYSGPKDELALLSRVLNDFIERLKHSMEAQRIFLAETSHELRTPLTSLQGFLERASRRAHPDVQRDLADAKRISQTMSRLVADLLQLSRGELVREYVPHLLDPYLDILSPIAEEFPGIRLSGQPGETLVGDPERLRQLVRNLTANAIKASGSAACVELNLITTESTVILEIADSGPGIPKEMLPYIFDKFYKGPGGGAGLGLAIAKQIAEAHQGTIFVESTLGEGATFRVVLPAADMFSEDESLELSEAITAGQLQPG